MTRKEQIHKARSTHPRLKDISEDFHDLYFCGFGDGVEWTEANPNYDPKNPFDKFAKFLNDPEYVEELEAKLAIAVQALEKLQYVNFPDKPCTGEEFAEKAFEMNCKIAKEALAKIGDKK